MGGRICSVCANEQTAAITKALTAGDSFRTVASRFGVTTAAAQRHAVTCLRIRRSNVKPPSSQAEKPSRESFDSKDPSSLIATTARLVDEALDLLEHAKKAADHRTALSALREARDGLALLMRTAGMLQGDGAVIDRRTQNVQVFTSLSDDDLRALVAAGRAVNAGVAQLGTTG